MTARCCAPWPPACVNNTVLMATSRPRQRPVDRTRTHTHTHTWKHIPEMQQLSDCQVWRACMHATEQGAQAGDHSMSHMSSLRLHAGKDRMGACAAHPCTRPRSRPVQWSQKAEVCHCLLPWTAPAQPPVPYTHPQTHMSTAPESNLIISVLAMLVHPCCMAAQCTDALSMRRVQ